MMPLVVTTILALFLTILAPEHSRAEDVDMVLTKNLTKERANFPGQYTVQPGDCLHRILRRLGLPGKAIPAYLSIVESANPSIRDLNLIRPGQVLIFPPPSNAGPQASKGPTGGTEGKPSPVSAPMAAAPSRIPVPPTAATPTVAAPAALVPEQAFVRLGETVQNKGSLYIPILEAGTLSLDSARYPLISLGSGTMLILDARDTIPVTIKELIEKTWPNYRLVRLGDAASPEEALDRLLRQSNYATVARSKDLVLGGDVKVSLTCDWLVEKTPDSIVDGSLYAINYARYPREVIPKAIREYAGRHNIQVINVPAAAEEDSRLDPVPSAARATAESLRGASRVELLGKLLTRLGLPFLSDLDLTLYAEEGGGVTMTFKTDILVEGARRLVISLREISPALARLMDAQEIDHVTILPDLSPQQTLVALVSALRLSHTFPQVEFREPGSEGKDKFTITVPGVMVTNAGESLLFTDTAPEEPILAFLADQGVKVILY